MAGASPRSWRRCCAPAVSGHVGAGARQHQHQNVQAGLSLASFTPNSYEWLTYDAHLQTSTVGFLATLQRLVLAASGGIPRHLATELHRLGVYAPSTESAPRLAGQLCILWYTGCCSQWGMPGSGELLFWPPSLKGPQCACFDTCRLMHTQVLPRCLPVVSCLCGKDQQHCQHHHPP
jgi:hypothetical protein